MGLEMQEQFKCIICDCEFWAEDADSCPNKKCMDGMVYPIDEAVNLIYERVMAEGMEDGDN